MSISAGLGMFTTVPVRDRGELSIDEARAGFRTLPGLGLALGLVAGLPLAAVHAWAPHAVAVAAAVSVGLLAVLTRGLHLDGLADTADGLGSRAPAERALAIMKQSDIGPFGVMTLVLVLLVDVLALTVMPHGLWAGVAALGVAAATGRVAAFHVSAAPAARPDGFGALVAGAVGRWLQVDATISVLVLGGLLGWLAGASWWWWPIVQLVALAAAFLLRAHTTRRFGGTTGDVYGAVIETATAVTLAGLCLR